MMRHVQHTSSAKADTSEALAYLGERSPDASERLATELDQRITLLASQPLMGRMRDDLSPGLRSSVVGKYHIFYRFTDDELRVVRILRGSRNVEGILRGDDD